MLLRAELIRKLGGFDDRFFLYWEDVELSLRVRQSGAQIALIPAARIHHKVSQSSQKVSHICNYYSVRNHLLLALLHGGKWRRKAVASIIYTHLRAGLRSVLKKEQGSIPILRMTVLALQHHFQRRYGSLASSHCHV